MGLKQSFKAILQNVSGVWKLSPVYIILLLNLWMLTNAPRLFGSGSTQVRWMIMMYITMVVSSVALAPTRPDLIKGDITQIFNFFWIFFVSAVVFAFTSFLPLGFQTFAVTAGLGSILLQAFTVAFSEEFFFRGVIEEITGSKIVSNVMFGPWHWATYGGEIWRMGVATVVGFSFSLIKSKFTILGSMGAHTAWNLRAMGELEKLIKV